MMAKYEKPFWEHPENINRNITWAINRTRDGKPWTGQNKSALIRLLEHLRPEEGRPDS